MRTTALALALLLSGAAIAQTTPPDVDVDANMGVQPDGDLAIDPDAAMEPGMNTTPAIAPTTQTHMNHTTLAANANPASGPLPLRRIRSPRHWA